MVKSRDVKINGLFSVLLLILMLLYPFLVYQHIEEVSPAWFAGGLLIALVLRFAFVAKVKHISDWLMLGVASVFFISVMLYESKQLLKFYPVLMNLGMGLIFIISLKGKQSLIETFAKAGGKTPPPQARGYLRSLTLMWGVLLILNAAISAYTAWFTSLSTWAFYNGLLSYLLIASFAAGEWVYRGHYKKKHNIVDE